MKVLIADDDPVTREILASLLTTWGYDVLPAEDGHAVVGLFEQKDHPLLAVIDWEMPGISGIDICRRLRQAEKSVYVLLLTARDKKASVIEGLEAGANDYITKPFDKEELRVRVRKGAQVVELQSKLAARLNELEKAAGEIAELKGKLQLPL